MRIDDYIHLGCAVPEESKTHGISVCSAGYSRELNGLVRIYPTTMTDRLRRWQTYQLELRRNPKDSRRESWRLARDDRPPLETASVGRISEDDRWEDIQRLTVPSIKWLNDNRRSLGIIQPRAVRMYFVENPSRMPLFEQGTLPGLEKPRGPGRHVFELWPYLEFTDEDGTHNASLLEWGAYEYLRKRLGPLHELWHVYRRRDGQIHLLVGNINRHRNVFIVIGVLVVSDTKQLGLFSVG